jgi:hypothetical protein
MRLLVRLGSHLLLQVCAQGSQGPFPKQEINFLQTQALGLLEQEEDGREGDDNVESHKDKVVLPGKLVQGDGADLRKEGADQPVADAGCEGIALGANSAWCIFVSELRAEDA